MLLPLKRWYTFCWSSNEIRRILGIISGGTVMEYEKADLTPIFSCFYHIQKSFLEILHMILVMLKKLSNGWGKWWKLNLVEPLEVVHQNALDILVVVTWKKKMFCNDPWSLRSRHCVYIFWNGKRWLNKKSDRKLQFLCG